VTVSPSVLRGVDRAALAVALAARLRDRGCAVGFPAIGDLVHALEVAAPTTRTRLYWTARICLVRRVAELPVFDAVFAAVFDDAVLKVDSNAQRTSSTSQRAHTRSVDVLGTESTGVGAGLPWATLPQVATAERSSDIDAVVPHLLPSELAGLADLPFEQLSDQDLAQLQGWLQAAVRTWPRRRTRRVRIGTRGHRVALRPTLARSRSTGWEPVHLVCTRRVDKPRRVVVLCDVSQSMQPQALTYLHLMRALALTVDAEVFAFSTRLTRLTSVLAHKSAQTAIEQATAKVVDRFGGTRIATNVQALLASHHGNVVRGAIVLIGSDGWDSDPPEQLAKAMARLRRRADRVIWLNPRASAPGFEPTVASMAAALPFCDAMEPVDTVGSLATLIANLRGAVSSTTSRGSRGGTGRR
jgi:uncharacterized protein with von Willebrand factor type A (vWA) domain